MRKLHLNVLFAMVVALPLTAHAGPRDANAVLNRCGAPTLGDTTIYENSLSGGRRILKYIRGTVNFDRMQNDGWTFTFGEHGKDPERLTADQMDKFMPCLKLALADSASAAPIQKETSVARVETSVKDSYKIKFAIVLGVLLLLVIGYFIYARITRPSSDEDDD